MNVKDIRPCVCRVLVRANSSSDRKWDADDGSPTVTFRSMAGMPHCCLKLLTFACLSKCLQRVCIAANVKYIWPLQAPLSDAGAQRKRLDAVRKLLGWTIIGCDYLECFS